MINAASAVNKTRSCCTADVEPAEAIAITVYIQSKKNLIKSSRKKAAGSEEEANRGGGRGGPEAQDEEYYILPVSNAEGEEGTCCKRAKLEYRRALAVRRGVGIIREVVEGR